MKEKPRFHKLTGDLSLNNAVVKASPTWGWERDAFGERWEELCDK